MAISIQQFEQDSKFYSYDSTGEFVDENSKDIGINLWFGNMQTVASSGKTTNGKYYHLNVAPSAYTDNYTVQTNANLPIGANKQIGNYVGTTRSVSVTFTLTFLNGTRNDKGEIVDINPALENSIEFMNDFDKLCNPRYNDNPNNDISYITGVPEVILQVNKNSSVYGIAKLTRSYDLNSIIIDGKYSIVQYTVSVDELRSNA